MKKSLIVTVILFVLAGTAFTAVQDTRHPERKAGFCCKKISTEKQEKKVSAPVHYLPVVNFF